MHFLYCPACIQQSAEALKGDVYSDAHYYGKNGNQGTSPAACYVQSGIKGFKTADLTGLPAGPSYFYRITGHSFYRRNKGSIPGGRKSGDEGKEEGDSNACQDRKQHSCTAAGNGCIQFLRAFGQEQAGIEKAGSCDKDSLCGKRTCKNSRRQPDDKENQQLEGYQSIKLSPFASHGPESSVILNPLCDGNLQDIINHKPCGKKDKAPCQNAGCSHKGKAVSCIGASFFGIIDAKGIK